MHRSRVVAATVVATLVAALTAVNVTIVDQTPATAAGALFCGDVYTQQGQSPRNIWQIDRETGAQTVAGTFSISGATGNLNGTGIHDADGDGYGEVIIGVLPANSGTARSIYQYSSVTGQTTLLGAGVAGAAVTHGAINAANGHYYYGGLTNGTLNVYGFNTQTNQSMGLVASGPVPNGGANGDWAFDSQGNLFVVAGGNGAGTTNIVSVVEQDIPSAGGTTVPITAKELVRIDTGGTPLNGIGFAGDGYLYVAGGSRMYKVNPTTGQNISNVAFPTAGSVDMASCASPNSVTVVKDFPQGRNTSSDQVTMTITGDGITSGNTATTSGTAPGVQPQQAGPVLVLSGQRITVAETGSGVGRPKYDTRWSCVDQNTGNSLGSGDGGSGTFTVPDGGAKGVAALCTFTNDARLPAVSLEKTADKTTLVAGETVTYSFRVTNTGNVPLTDVSVAETAFTGAGSMSAVSCPALPEPLAPDASVTCTATYTVQQADVNAGSVENTATARAVSPDEIAVTSDPSSVTITADQNASLSIVKSSDTAELVVGETVTFSFVVTNTGNVTLTDVGVNEGAFTGAGTLSAVDCPADRTLAPGAQLVCTATYTVQQADVDAGSMRNDATATGTPPTGPPVTSEPSETTTPSVPDPSVSIAKMADKTDLVVGETVTYSFRVTNTGNVTLTDVSVKEDDFTGAGDLSAIACPADRTLSPGEFLDCTATYVVQQADVDAGSVTNAATSSGTPPTGDPVTSDPSEVTITGTSSPSITVVKSADKTDLVVGETVTYSFRVTNTGNVTLTDVSVKEDDFTGAGDLSAIACPADRTLSPGEFLDCTATYVVQQADVDAGSVTNSATSSGTPPTGDPVTSDPSEVTITGTSSPSITVVKSADKTDLVVGETVTYSFRVTNTGNVTLTDVAVNEGAFSGAGALSAIECPANRTLAPGAELTCTATYVVQQADVDAGSVTNSATSSGTPPTGDPVTSDPSEVTITGTQKPAIEIVKSSDTTELVAGETVTFSFVVTNTGNVTLTDVAVNEGDFTGAGDLSAIECPANRTLAPGAQLVCTATYTVQQADVDAGTVRNSATATGSPPTGDPIESEPSEVTTPSVPDPSVSIVKTADKTELVAGETVTYSFRVTNTGNVTLTDAAVVEGAFTGAGALSAIACPADRTLAPAEFMDCTATYLVQQADVDAGSVKNSATATGNPPTGDPVASDPSTVTITADQDPAIGIVKTADKTTLVAGETVTYTFTVTNTGTVTLSDVAVAEGAFSGAGRLSALDCPADRTLAPGAQLVCTATYTVQQADVDAGSVTNDATATGNPPTGDPVTSEPSEVTITADQTPGIALVKTADKTTLVVGETVTYTFTVTNTGNVTLSEVAVSEGAFSGAGQLSAVDCPADRTLAPGAQLVCTATYTVQQADVDAGSVTNDATATGNPPQGDPITSPPSEVTITADQTPGIALVKSADKTNLVAGETVTYTFTVTNTGNVTLSGVAVAEGAFSGAGQLSALDCPVDRTIAPGADLVCTATYTVQQADVDAGSVTNDATATGNPPQGEPVTSPPSEVTITGTQSPGITIVKSADKDELVLGETITYSFVVTNTGNVTLTDVAVDEGAFTGAGTLSAIECPADRTLSPGAQLICTATYTVQQADVDAGTVANDATATGTPPNGEPITSEPSGTTTPSVPNPAIAFVKSADKTDLVVGETVTYTFTATNTGNVTLKDVAIAEGEFSGAGALSALECPADRTLIPGQQLVCTATYTVQQADVDAGSVTNTATASGNPPTGGPVTSEPSTVVVEGTPSPALTLVKSSDTSELVVGATVTFSFVATNTGNTTLTDVTVVEGEFTGAGELSALSCPADRTLAPGEQLVCTATYVVQQADVDAGTLRNTATATGTPPSGEPIESDPSEVTTPSTPKPALSLVKTADKSTVAAGDTVTYTFRVTNVGTVTLRGVAVVEGAFSGAGELSALDCPADRTLAPSEFLDCTATYVVQQADVDAGSITNDATATGNPPQGEPIVSDPSAVTVTAEQKPGISIVKSADKTQLVVGETITYSFVVTNTGTVTLTDVGVTEGDFTGAGELSAVECPADRTLVPGAQLICTATYTVQQADVDAGSVTNTATATGTPPGGEPIESEPSTTTTGADPAPSLSIVKTADTAVLVAGESVTYTFTVTNTGNVTLADVTVLEGEFSGAGDLSALECPADRTLIPGQQLVCTATYTVQQADVDAGSVTNTATATGTPPGGGEVGTDPSTVVIETTPAPALTVVKTADKSAARVGETITYTFTVTNTGNVTITDVTVVEGEFNGSGPLSTPVCEDGARRLAPGESVVCTATYVVQQADEKKGDLVNTATATGKTPAGGIESPPSSTTTRLLVVDLPPTGGEIAMGAIGASAVLVLVGVALVVIARRRRGERTTL
ncbi:hypothetical protein ACH4U4_18935 [Microbacterium resistens]|uniref:DUF7507 domain-containing protein n=1 Tax=Microbacterium resistens TaxID=156977 RepID=UPI0037A5B231